MPQGKPRKPIADLIEELKSWLPNYDHGEKEYPTVLYRILASAPGGDELADVGYEPFNLGWHEIDQLGRVLVAIQDKRDVEDIVQALLHADDEEERVEEHGRQRGRQQQQQPMITYPKSPSGQYVLRRDGQEVMRGTEDEVWQWLHRNHSYSVDHALRHEGYSIEPVESTYLGEARRAPRGEMRPDETHRGVPIFIVDRDGYWGSRYGGKSRHTTGSIVDVHGQFNTYDDAVAAAKHAIDADPRFTPQARRPAPAARRRRAAPLRRR